jgi:cyclophilin family peptidyl-prolyl cis-trans isomerase
VVLILKRREKASVNNIMKVIPLLLIIILFSSACASPFSNKEISGNNGADGKSEEKSMNDNNSPFAKRFLEELGHTDLAAEYEHAVIKTNFGDIKVEFFADKSPITVNNFLNLAKSGFYDGVKFHRVIKDFMIQGGDPNSKDEDPDNDGIGGPGYRFADEINDMPLVKGSLAMANSGANTNGSQFFIVTAESASWLDGKHTNFGQVVEGMESVFKIEDLPTDRSASENPNSMNFKDRPMEDVIINTIELLKE